MPDELRHIAPLVLTAAVMVFAVYRRARAHIGRQRLRPTRLKVRIGLLCLVALAVMGSAPVSVLVYAGLGAAVGIGLALCALHLTRIERTPEGVCYQGNVYIGLAVISLLILRVGYRLVTAADAMQTATAPIAPARPLSAFAANVSNPLTVGIFLTMVGYYVVYYVGLLAKAAQSPPEANPSA